MSSYLTRWPGWGVAGYNEGYMKNVLQHAFRIIDKKKEELENGVRAMFRKKEWAEVCYYRQVGIILKI